MSGKTLELFENPSLYWRPRWPQHLNVTTLGSFSWECGDLSPFSLNNPLCNFCSSLFFFLPSCKNLPKKHWLCVQVLQGSDWWYYNFQLEGNYKGSPTGHKTALHFFGNAQRPLREEQSVLDSFSCTSQLPSLELQTCRLCYRCKTLGSHPPFLCWGGAFKLAAHWLMTSTQFNEHLSFTSHKVSSPKLGTNTP